MEEEGGEFEVCLFELGEWGFGAVDDAEDFFDEGASFAQESYGLENLAACGDDVFDNDEAFAFYVRAFCGFAGAVVFSLFSYKYERLSDVET